MKNGPSLYRPQDFLRSLVFVLAIVGAVLLVRYMLFSPMPSSQGVDCGYGGNVEVCTGDVP